MGRKNLSLKKRLNKDSTWVTLTNAARSSSRRYRANTDRQPSRRFRSWNATAGSVYKSRIPSDIGRITQNKIDENRMGYVATALILGFIVGMSALIEMSKATIYEDGYVKKFTWQDTPQEDLDDIKKFHNDQQDYLNELNRIITDNRETWSKDDASSSQTINGGGHGMSSERLSQYLWGNKKGFNLYVSFADFLYRTFATNERTDRLEARITLLENEIRKKSNGNIPTYMEDDVKFTAAAIASKRLNQTIEVDGYECNWKWHPVPCWKVEQ